MINFFKYVLINLILPLFSLGAINYCIDSRAYFNDSIVISLENSLRLNGTQSIFFNIPERKLLDIRLNNIVNDNKKRNVIIGSSKTLLVGKNTNQKIFNAGFSNFSYQDFKFVRRKLNKSRVRIDTLYINIDPVLFNPNSNLDQWKNFSYKITPTKIKRLFSMAYLFENFKTPKFSNWDGNDVDFLRYSDGSIRYHKKDRTRIQSNIILDQMKNNLSDINLDNYFFKDFEDEIFKINANHTVLVLAPYSPIIFDKVLNENSMITKLENKIYSMIQDEISVIGSFNPENDNYKLRHFYDQVHLNEEGIKKLYNKY